MVGVGRREVEASPQERAVRRVGCCLEVEEEVQRIPVLTRVRILLVGAGEVRASLVEH